MTTTDEIQRRVQQADTARSAKRSAAAQQVGELARRRSTIAEQLDEVERELGDVLAAATDVIDIGELARFTDVPAADLTRWLTARKTTRTKRPRPAGAADTGTNRDPSAARTPTAGRASARPEADMPRAAALDGIPPQD